MLHCPFFRVLVENLLFPLLNQSLINYWVVKLMLINVSHLVPFFFRDSTALGGHVILTVEVPRYTQDTPHSVGLLWTSDQTDTQASTWIHSQETGIQAPGGIRTRNPTGIHSHLVLIVLINCITLKILSSPTAPPHCYKMFWSVYKMWPPDVMPCILLDLY